MSKVEAMMCGPLWSHRRRAVGNVTVELAWVLPVLLVMAMGCVEVGRALWAYDRLCLSVRAAVRHLATGQASDPLRQSQARCLAITGKPDWNGVDCLAAPWVAGLRPQQVQIFEPGAHESVRALATGHGVVNLVTVSVSVVRWPTLGWVWPTALTWGPISLSMVYV